MTVHCDHCAEQCSAEDPIGWGVLGVHTDSDDGSGAEWTEGHCPACKERERIAKTLHAQSLKVAQTPSTDIDCFWVGYISALDDTAADLAKEKK